MTAIRMQDEVTVYGLIIVPLKGWKSSNIWGKYVEIKCQLDATEVFIADLIACSTCFGAPLCPSSGAQGYYTVVAACGIPCCGFSSCWSGAELKVMCPVCRMLQHPANRTHNPQLRTRPAT